MNVVGARVRGVGLAVSLVAFELFATRAAHAEKPQKPAETKPSAPSTGTPSTPSTNPSSTGHTSVLVRLARDAMRSLGDVPAGTTIVVSPLVSDLTAPRAEELSVRLASLVAGVSGTAHAHPEPASLAVARGLSGRGAGLVYVQIEIAKGDLRVTADAYPVVSNGWDRLRNPVPGPRAHAFVKAPIDAEIRSYLSPILLEQAKVHKTKIDEPDVVAPGMLALACGDVDGDGGAELVVASRARVSLARVRGGKLVVERSTPWNKLASRVPVPMRDPLATAVVSQRSDEGGEIFVGTTDRGGVRLDEKLVARAELTGLPVTGLDGDGCAVPRPETSAYEGGFVACRRTPGGNDTSQVVLESPISMYDAASTVGLVDKTGSISEVVAQRETNGRLHLRTTGTKTSELTMDDVGVPMVLADLDLDGVPEIVTTTNTSTDDELIVSSLQNDKIAPRLRFPAKEGVRALAVCPPEERGVPALVAVVGNEVWIVR